MATIDQANTFGRIALSLRLMLPGSRRGWLILLLAALAVILLTLVLARVFQPVATSTTPTDSGAVTLEWRDTLNVLNRYSELDREGLESVGIEALLTTPEYFAAARRQPPENAVSEPSLLFYVTETTHIDDLPVTAPAFALSVDGSPSINPVETIVIADSYHHRSTMFRYALSSFDGLENLTSESVVQLRPADLQQADANLEALTWELPLQYSEDYASAAITLGVPNAAAPLPGVSGVAVLAVLGGLLAAMWPCLFQLTAYFIPAMAGMSMNEVSTATGLKPRVGVVRTAFFFVVGFTIVYTLAGAVIGFGSQALSTMPSFYIWQRYLSIGAGVILFVLAFRVAARARAPLVCKMPIAARMAHKGVTSPWESMLVGITFATGCMTCFGSAILIGMVLYVGLAGSPLVGAGLLFLFSLGMGIPLVIGAIAMAKVLPLLFRVEKVAPWMGLGSATLIAGYALLLITGNSMAISSWFYRLMGMASPITG